MANNQLILLVVLIITLVRVAAQFYSNQWVISGNLNQNDIANIARRYGFTFVTKLLDDNYLFIKNNSPMSSKVKSRYLAKHINREKNVSFHEVQVKSSSQQFWQPRALRQSTFTVNDAKWNNMWYYNRPKLDIGLEASWKEGYDGSGVTIAIVDDGVDYTHPDLKDNYVNGLDTYDNDKDPMPSPPDKHGTECAGVAVAVKNHQCVIGAAFKANLTAVRLIGPFGATDAGEQQAFKLPGVDIFSNSWGATDRTTFDGPKALSEAGLVHGITNGRGGLGSIYITAAGNGGFEDNCNCDGYANSIYTIAIMGVTKKLEPPGYSEFCAAALASAYSGPGGSTSDDVCTTSPGNSCPCDFTGTSAAAPMAAGILALVLQANPKLTWRDVQYLIIKTSITTGLTYGGFFVNGAGRKVSDTYGYGLLNSTALIAEAKTWTTVDPHHLCTTGTKTINRNQFYKQLWHISTSRMCRSRSDCTHVQADLSLHVLPIPKYSGFIMTRVNIGTELPSELSDPKIIANDVVRAVENEITTDGCNNTNVCVDSVEHVEVEVSFFASLRGAVKLTLQSPMGTSSKLLTRRNRDVLTNLQQDWTYMSVQFWEEYPVGTWKLKMDLDRDPTESATLIRWSLRLYGTGESCSTSIVAPTIVPSQGITTDFGQTNRSDQTTTETGQTTPDQTTTETGQTTPDQTTTETGQTTPDQTTTETGQTTPDQCEESSSNEECSGGCDFLCIILLCTCCCLIVLTTVVIATACYQKRLRKKSQITDLKNNNKIVSQKQIDKRPCEPVNLN